MKNVKIITIESDFGAGKKGAKLGPQAMLKILPQHIFQNSEITKISAEEFQEEKNEIFTKAHHINSVIHIQKKAIDCIQKNHTDGFVSFIASGDHSNGLAAISAYKDLYPTKKLGVIWIDAHSDLHTPHTSPSGNLHGMPLGAALGLDYNSKVELDKETQLKWKQLIQLGHNKISPKILPSELVFIDIRDMEPEEMKIIQEKNILHFMPKDRKEIGIQSIIEKSLLHLSHCDHIYISFDVDSLDPTISAGTGTPVPGGLSKEEAKKLISAFWNQPNVFAFEITEINPLLDRINPMEEVAAGIIADCFSA